MKISTAKVMTLFIYGIIILAMVFSWPDSSYAREEVQLYICLFVSVVWVGGLFANAIINRNLYLFEMLSIVSFLFFGIFLYRPIQDLFNHSIQYGGVDLLPGSVKATILFDVGYTALYLGYYSRKRNKEIVLKRGTIIETSSTISLVMLWLVFISLGLVVILRQGYSLRYILSFGSQGMTELEDTNSTLLFLSNFGVSAVVTWVLIISTPCPKSVKIITGIITAAYLVARNARWLILVMFAAPIVYHYIKEQKKPKMVFVSILGLIALVVFAWMQNNRYTIRAGQQMGSIFDVLNLQVLLSPFDSDFTTYTSFYGMVMNFPKNHSYMFGQTFAYVVILFVPRILWPGKPDNPVRDMIENSIGSLARSNGRAVPNIGEFYANFGVIGVIILMFLFGYIISRLNNMYRENNKDRMVMYSVLYPLMFQWVARGNFSGNFYYTLFAFIPFICLGAIRSLLSRRR